MFLSNLKLQNSVAAGVESNLVNTELIDYSFTRFIYESLSFFVLLLAEGFICDDKEKELLKENIILKFLVQSGVDFCVFFQNVNNHTEFVNGLLEIRKCIRARK